MFNEERSDDYTPLAVWGRLPIYLTELLVGLHLASMVLTSLWTGFFRNRAWMEALIYNPAKIVHGELWRLISYAALDFPPSGFGPVIWFLIGLLMLWWCGRQIEQFYGRNNFLKCYLLLVLLPALFGLLPGLWTPMAGPGLVHFGVFLMFAATYPGVQLMFGIPAKWMAWAFLFFNTLVSFANQDRSGLVWLWITALTAYSLTRLLGRGDWLPESWQARLPSFRQPKFQVVKSSPPERVEDPVSSVDLILEKIARKGLGSLSAKERAALQAASGELQKRGGR